MKKFVKYCLALLVLLSFVVVSSPGLADAAYGKNASTSSYKNYIRSGKYPGGFLMELYYSETYDSFTATAWKITKQHDLTTLNDQYLSLSSDSQSTNYYRNGTYKAGTTSFSACSSSIYDPNELTLCRDAFYVYYPYKNETRSTHKSSVVLPTNYNPQIFTLSVNLYY